MAMFPSPSLWQTATRVWGILSRSARCAHSPESSHHHVYQSTMLTHNVQAAAPKKAKAEPKAKAEKPAKVEKAEKTEEKK
jgi:hypothetical protein